LPSTFDVGPREVGFGASSTSLPVHRDPALEHQRSPPAPASPRPARRAEFCSVPQASGSCRDHLFACRGAALPGCRRASAGVREPSVSLRRRSGRISTSPPATHALPPPARQPRSPTQAAPPLPRVAPPRRLRLFHRQFRAAPPPARLAHRQPPQFSNSSASAIRQSLSRTCTKKSFDVRYRIGRPPRSSVRWSGSACDPAAS